MCVFDEPYLQQLFEQMTEMFNSFDIHRNNVYRWRNVCLSIRTYRRTDRYSKHQTRWRMCVMAAIYAGYISLLWANFICREFVHATATNFADSRFVCVYTRFGFCGERIIKKGWWIIAIVTKKVIFQNRCLSSFWRIRNVIGKSEMIYARSIFMEVSS